MINHNEFAKMRENYAQAEAERENTIQDSREIIQLSKRIIYAVQREQLDEAGSLLGTIKERMSRLNKECPDTNIHKVAAQEYVEALVFYEFIYSGKVLTASDLEVTDEEYLLGLCDVSGELVRMAVRDTIYKRYENVKKYHELLEELYAEMLKFNFRNSELRKKSDQIKWGLKKVEEILLELGTKGLV